MTNFSFLAPPTGGAFFFVGKPHGLFLLKIKTDMKCNCDNDQKIINHVEGNTLTCAIPLQDRITRFVDGEKVTTVEDFYPLDTDTVTVKLTTGFTTVIPMECQVTDNVVTFTDNGTLPAARYGIEVSVVRASGDKKRYYSAYEINIVPETSEAGIPDDIEYDVETYDLEAAIFDMMRGYSAYEIWLQQGHTGTEEDFLEWLSGQGQIDAKIEEVYENIAREYVRKVTGMGLSQNDFTNILKTKLESLENYDDTQVRAQITSLTNRLDTLVGGDVTQAIDTFNEIIAFLDGLDDTQSLAQIIASIQSEIAGKADAATTYTKTEADTKFATNETVNGAAFLGGESGSSTTADFDPQTDTVWNIPQVLGSSAKAQARTNIGAQEQLVSGTNVKTVNGESILGQGNITIQGSGEANVIETVKVNGNALTPDANKAVDITVPAAVTEQTVSGWGFTKNTGTYSKPSSGIPASDLAQGVIPDISGKEDKILLTPASGTALTAEAGHYYRFDNAVGILTVTLPTPTTIANVILFFTTSTTPNVTLSHSSILYHEDYEIAASSTYEVNCLWNGTAWIVASIKIGGAS